jgi:exopolyphosphatase / guanosine-5'-triphosphate,3'-diphosphate pyrophosphatase
MQNPASNGVNKKRVTAIDLGTNSFHAVIVDVFADGTFETVDALKEMVTLGKNGVGYNLTPESMNLGIDALKKFKTLSDSYRSDLIIAYATSAIREAPNGGEFIQRAIDEVRIKIQAIPGIMEAELIAHAVQHSLNLGSQKALIIDIGGGSTEFIISDQSDFYYLDSQKIGVSRMTSEYIKSDPISKKEIKSLEDHYKMRLQNVIQALVDHMVPILVGTSGTMQNIAAMIAAEKKMNTSLTLNEFEYTSDDFFSFCDRFLKLDRKRRLETPGLDPKRVDFIVAGVVLVQYLLKSTAIKRIKTSTEAMREGIILRYTKREKNELSLLSRYPDNRRRSIHELLIKCNWHEQHSTQVSKIALQIFDDLQDYHHLTNHDRELLDFAALTHDIGYHISHKKHHKHALYLILNADLKGFQQEEIEIIANVARYHRRSTPKARHSHFDLLNPTQKSTIRALSGILRVADGLDRSHFQNVTKLKIDVTEKITIRIITVGDPELEIWSAMRKSELFQKFFNRPLEIIHVQSF